MAMRMLELTERSGLPRTTIHHYVREGLLPPARKTAPNAAEYGDDHLQRLRLITKLRGEEGGALSIPEIRRVLRLTGRGMALRGAVRLVREGLAPEATDWTAPAELAASAGCPASFVEELVETGLLPAAAEFSPGDLLVARACRAVCEDRGIDPADLKPLADLIREVGHYSETLVEVQDLRGETAEERAEPGGYAAGLRRDLSGLGEALLWRSFERTDDSRRRP